MIKRVLGPLLRYRPSRVSLLGRLMETVQKEVTGAVWSDGPALRHAAWVSLWWRWVAWLVVVGQASYRPEWEGGVYLPFVAMHVAVVAGNGLLHFRLASGRSVSWAGVLALSALDFVVTTSAIFVGGGFSNYYYFMYYPALALMAVVCPSFIVGVLWTTVIVVVYGSLSFLVGSGLELGTNDEKQLFLRLFCMYAVVLGVTLVVWQERARRQDTEQRERALLEQGLEMAQALHDTAAQSAYMVGIGIENAMVMADQSDEKLMNSLRATRDISRSVMWELRHPIDVGLFYAGGKLGQVLSSHAARLTRLTSVAAEVVESGREPFLTPTTRGLLFSIAHNAMTNAFRHAGTDSIRIALEYGDEQVRMSITDDGVGLPEDYAQRGHGFRNMESAAQRAGGRLEVGRGPAGVGTTVSCVLPLPTAVHADLDARWR